MDSYRLFRPQYLGRDGKKHISKTYHVEFKDHLGIRQRVMAYPHARDTEKFANRLAELVSHRRNGETLSPGLSKWLDSLPDKLRARFAAMDLLDATGKGIDRPLRFHLDGAAEGSDGTPGYKQELQARGVTYNHIRTTVPRIAAVLDGAGFVLWRDLRRPGAAGDVTLYLGKLREAGEINGRTFCYYVRDLRTFCRWLAQRLGRDVPLQDLRGVDNAEADADKRRELSPEEMIRLIAAAASSKRIRENLTGDERALLYRFAFETGMRPGQIRALTVSDFDLEAQPAIVCTHAKYVKRRRDHVQLIRPELAAELRERFRNKMPTATAFKMASVHNMADMLRFDLAAARAAWLDEKGIIAKERAARARSDFLLAVNHQGERAVFYSTRHAHGSALAAAGVPEKDIAASLHHSNRSTTRRYLHSRRPELVRAIAALPDVAYKPSAVRATPRKRKAAGGN